MTRILIVEDDAAIAFALEADLESEGYEVSVSTTGDDGLRRAREEGFDLVLLDVMLPGPRWLRGVPRPAAEQRPDAHHRADCRGPTTPRRCWASSLARTTTSSSLSIRASCAPHQGRTATDRDGDARRLQVRRR